MMKMKKISDQALAKQIPHLYQSFQLREYANLDGLEEGICDLFEENDSIIEKEIVPDGIRDSEHGEQLQNWIHANLDSPIILVEGHCLFIFENWWRSGLRPTIIHFLNRLNF